MYEGKPRTLFFRFAVPQMIGLLFNSVYTIVDGVFIGHRLGREAMAAAAVGADGLMVEVHNDPPCAKCDGAQSLTPEKFRHLMAKLTPLVRLMEKKLV